MINFVSFFTSMYAGLAVFSIIGFMAKENNMDIEDVIESGLYQFLSFSRIMDNNDLIEPNMNV